MGLRKRGWEDTEWVYLLWDRDKFRVLVKVVINPQLPQNLGNFLSSSGCVGLSRRMLPYDSS